METAIKLKKYIKEKYSSIREFTIDCNIPYTTIDSIFRRGINNSSVSSINKICSALNISIEALMNNEIVPIDKNSQTQNISGAIQIAETFLKNAFTLSTGDKLSEKDIKAISNIYIEFLLRAK